MCACRRTPLRTSRRRAHDGNRRPRGTLALFSPLPPSPRNSDRPTRRFTSPPENGRSTANSKSSRRLLLLLESLRFPSCARAAARHSAPVAAAHMTEIGGHAARAPFVHLRGPTPRNSEHPTGRFAPPSKTSVSSRAKVVSKAASAGHAACPRMRCPRGKGSDLSSYVASSMTLPPISVQRSVEGVSFQLGPRLPPSEQKSAVPVKGNSSYAPAFPSPPRGEGGVRG